MFRSFQAKLTLFFVAMVTTVQIVTLIAVYAVTTQNVIEQITSQLIHAGQIFDRQAEGRAQRLSDEARILAADFGFRGAVSSEDRETILSALRNLGTRIGSDRSMLISLDNSIIVDTHHDIDSSVSFPFLDLIGVAEREDRAFSVLSMDGTILEFVVVPVLAPEPIAWIGIGFQMDDALAADFKNLSPKAADITFISRNDGEDWHLTATTLSHVKRKRLPALLRKIPAFPRTTKRDPDPTRRCGDVYFTRVGKSIRYL